MRALRVEAPPRIATEQDALGELVRAAVDYSPRIEQGPAFERLLERAQGRRSVSWSLPRAFAFVAACAVVAAIALFGLRGRWGIGELPNPAQAKRQVAPSAQPIELVSGDSELEDGTRVHVESKASAKVEQAPAGSRVALESGTVTLEVAKQTQGRTLEVRAKGHRFVVLGTVFSVSASQASVVLSVREGRVAVFREQIKLAEVGAGETWTQEIATATELSPRPVAPAPVGNAVPEPEKQPSRAGGAPAAPTETNCLALARERRPRDAERCFVGQAAGAGLGAEMALFELARLRSDVLGDASGALTALNEYRTRFPGGSLRAEVDISYVHLLARLGRHGELLSESARVLATAKGRERSAEFRMLRANTFRTGMKDYASAEREYAEVERFGGKFAAEAGFYRGVCLEALGNRAAAKAAYQRYLATPGRPRQAEARRHLDELER